VPKSKTAPSVLDLLFALSDSCMHWLSANAWKVVSYVAAQCLRLYPERSGPALIAALNADLERMLGPDYVAQVARRQCRLDERVYRTVSTEFGESQRFAVVSLEQICRGVRIRSRRFQDYGTGLGKSSAAEAINEAIRAGILIRKRRKDMHGRDVASLYAIDWDRVLELDWLRKRGKAGVRRADSKKRPQHPR
jgi:hypothetical protein